MSGENSPLFFDEIRTHTAAISSSAAGTLIAKIAAAVVEILDQISNEAEINEQPDLAPPSNDGHYRELAGQLRLVAHKCRFPGARQEMLNLAIKYEQRANYFDQRSQ